MNNSFPMFENIYLVNVGILCKYCKNILQTVVMKLLRFCAILIGTWTDVHICFFFFFKHFARRFETFCNRKIFLRWGVVGPTPYPKLEDHPLSAVRDCLFNLFAATLRTRRSSLHPHPAGAPCRGDRRPT